MMDVAISPCPNDTFLFAPWIHQYIKSRITIQTTFADIATLNEMAMQKKYPLIKVSIAAFRKIKGYRLLPVGMALGYGVGPKLISREPLQNLSGKKVAIPGKDTTAELLFDHFFPNVEKHFCTYDQVLSLLKKGEVDAGVIIHETRFTYMNGGFFELVDLGELWEKKYNLPLPLGGLILRDDYSKQADEITSILQESYRYAKKNPSKLEDYILQYAQEKDRHVVKKHIDLYVTEETYALSEKGLKAVNQLINL